MVTTKLVEKIKEILCGLNKSEPEDRYASAWLSINDDLTGRERYILHVKAEHEIDSCFDELRNISNLLRQKLDIDAYRTISRVVVYDSKEDIHCWGEDNILVLEKDIVCSN